MLRGWRGIEVERHSLDLNSLLHDAFIVEQFSPEDRIRIFGEFNSLLEDKISELSPEDRARVLRAADESDPRPVPWWSGFRPDAILAGIHDSDEDSMSLEGK
jgi:hypothetical protein